jgi:hypothetical protein
MRAIMMSPVAEAQPSGEKRSMVRQRAFPATDLFGIFYKLTTEKFTGKVTLNVSQGTVVSAVAEDHRILGSG